METEKRILTDSSLKVETRGVGDKARTVITGKAISYNSLSQNLGGFKEQIDARALEGADLSDVVALLNHDNNYVLGRTSSKTLELENRADGLYYTIYPPKSAVGIIESIERGDIRGSSFQFSITSDGDEVEYNSGLGLKLRTVRKISKLYDISPVTFPAYLATDTTVAKRSIEAHEGKIQEQDNNNIALESEKRARELILINL